MWCLVPRQLIMNSAASERALHGNARPTNHHRPAWQYATLQQTQQTCTHARRMDGFAVVGTVGVIAMCHRGCFRTSSARPAPAT